MATVHVIWSVPYVVSFVSFRNEVATSAIRNKESADPLRPTSTAVVFSNQCTSHTGCQPKLLIVEVGLYIWAFADYISSMTFIPGYVYNLTCVIPPV